MITLFVILTVLFTVLEMNAIARHKINQYYKYSICVGCSGLILNTSLALLNPAQFGAFFLFLPLSAWKIYCTLWAKYD